MKLTPSSVAVFISILILIGWSARFTDGDLPPAASNTGEGEESAVRETAGRGSVAAEPLSHSRSGSAAVAQERRLVTAAMTASDETGTLELPPRAYSEFEAVLDVDGELHRAIRIGFQQGPREAIVDVAFDELRAMSRGVFAIATLEQNTMRWSGPMEVAALREDQTTFFALPLSRLRGSVNDARGGHPIEEALITAKWQDEPTWCDWLGADGAIEATTDQLGRFELEVACTGTLDLVCTSPLHQSGRLSVDVERAQHDLEPFALVARPTVRVSLIGAEGDAADYYAAHTINGTRAVFGDDWWADVPIDLEIERLDIAVGMPGDLEVTTHCGVLSSEPPEDGVVIDLSAGAVDVTLVGKPPVDERMLAVVFYTDASGNEVFSNVWAPSGETKRVPVGAIGEVTVDASFLGADRNPRTIVRRSVNIVPGEVRAITLELPERLRRLELREAQGARVTVGNVWFASPGADFLATPGGALDASGTALLPDLERSPIWLLGEATPEAVPFAGIPLQLRSPVDETTQVSLGEIETTHIELVTSAGVPVTHGTRVLVVCPRTGQMASLVEVPEGGLHSLRWFSASNAVLELESLDVWSPRDPIPLRPGSLRIPVVHRAWLALRIGERDLVEAVHQETGLTLAELRADPSVKIERYEAGVRLWGIPTGHYTVTLSGEQEPRGPFLATPAQWTVIERQYLE